MPQKRNKIFYGWFIVLALIFIWTVSQGIATHSFTAFIEPITNKFGWNYTKITLALSVYNLIAMLLSPIVGIAVDRWNARKLIFAGITISSIGIFLLSRIDSLGQLYLCYILMGIGGSTCVATVPLTILGRWFRKKLSLATSIVMSGGSVGGLLVPLITYFIDTIGWQTAMLITGLGMFVIISPLALIIRQNPEQYGYLPDGDANGNTAPGEVQTLKQRNGENIGTRQALKSRPFWHISLALMFHIFAPIAVQVHIMPYLSTIGIDRTTSSFTTSVMLISGIFGRLLFGWFGDKFDKRWVAASGTILVGISLLLLSFIIPISTWVLIPAVILCGIGWGGTTIMYPVLLRVYFGTRNLGSIIGFSMSITTIALIVSPPLTGWIFERFDDYRIAWLVLIGVVIVSVISQLTNPPVSTVRQRES